jgi:hypothetical protein
MRRMVRWRDYGLGFGNQDHSELLVHYLTIGVDPSVDWSQKALVIKETAQPNKWIRLGVIDITLTKHVVDKVFHERTGAKMPHPFTW